MQWSKNKPLEAFLIFDYFELEFETKTVLFLTRNLKSNPLKVE